MVAVEEYNRVVGQTVLLQLPENTSSLSIHRCDVVVVLRPVVPHFRRIRVIGGHTHFCGIMHQLVWPFDDLTFVRCQKIEDGKERLAGFAIAPVSLFA